MNNNKSITTYSQKVNLLKEFGLTVNDFNNLPVEEKRDIKTNELICYVKFIKGSVKPIHRFYVDGM